MAAKNILLTGPPRCGKSTLIEKVVRTIHLPMTGFFTREIREEGHRLGFRVVTLDGREGLLAHVQIHSPIRVGKYRVNVDDLDRVAVPAMIPSQSSELVIIDEIGKMECFSSVFRLTLERTLDSSNRVLASIALKGDRFIERIKTRPDVKLIVLSEQNRDRLSEMIWQLPKKVSDTKDDAVGTGILPVPPGQARRLSHQSAASPGVSCGNQTKLLATAIIELISKPGTGGMAGQC